MRKDVINARLKSSFDNALETLRGRWDEGAPTTPIIFKSPEKLGDRLERFP
jgi:hypothetical protein